MSYITLFYILNPTIKFIINQDHFSHFVNFFIYYDSNVRVFGEISPFPIIYYDIISDFYFSIYYFMFTFMLLPPLKYIIN